DNVGTLAGALLGGGNGGTLTFAIPETNGSQFGIDYDVCPGGANTGSNPPTCTPQVDLAKAKLAITTAAPHDITITGPLPFRLRDLPINITYFFIPDSTDATVTGNSGCPGDPSQTFADLPLDIDISIEIDNNQSHSRYGYTRVKIAK